MESSNLDISASELRSELRQTLTEMQSVTSRMISELPSQPTNAKSLEKSLGVDAQLAWSFFRLATDQDPLSAAGLIPGPQATKRFANAAAKRSVPRELSDRLIECRARLDAFGKEHAGDSDAFKILLDEFSGANRKTDMLRQRKSVFKSSRWMTGIDIQLATNTFLIWSGASDSEYHNLSSMACLRSMRHYRELNDNASFEALSFAATGLPSQSPSRPLKGSVTSMAGAEGLALHPEWCSSNLPEFRSRTFPIDGSQTIVVMEPVRPFLGTQGEFDVAMGRVKPDWIKKPEHQRVGLREKVNLRSVISKPVHRAVLDVLLPTQMLDTVMVSATLGLHQVAPGTIPSLFSTCLPLVESVEEFPVAGGLPGVLGFTDYARVVDLLFEDAGISKDGFTLLRLDVAYPHMGSHVVIHLAPPEDGLEA